MKKHTNDHQVVTAPGDLPDVVPAKPADRQAVILHQGHMSGATRRAVAATAKAAGASVVPLKTSDLRSDPSAIKKLAAIEPKHVIAAGSGYPTTSTLAERVAAAKTGVQLPGGGQKIFPGRRLVALYGHPGTSDLGVLGEQGLAASIARAKSVAGQYTKLSDVPVVPTFEIIATVASSAPGSDGNYSTESRIDSLKPWVTAAGKSGMYVVLDLQPGRAGLLQQAKRYAPLLKLPYVGLALDPEWKLTGNQRPLQQIGSVDAAEINQVSAWLSRLTAKNTLPQKLLVLHQFQVSMIGHEDDLNLTHDNVQLLIHMDGQGTPPDKEGTWAAVKQAAPAGVPFGWKDFYDEDQPMLTPKQTMDQTPRPMMISYQ